MTPSILPAADRTKRLLARTRKETRSARADILSRDEDPPHAVSESAIRAPSSAPAAIKANFFFMPLLRRSNQRRMHAGPFRMHHVTWHSRRRAPEGSKAMRTNVFRPKGRSDDSVLRRAEYGDASREPMPPERIIDVRMDRVKKPHRARRAAYEGTCRMNERSRQWNS